MPRLRSLGRRAGRCPSRRVAHWAIRVRWRGPDDLRDALVAFRRVVRLQQQLAKLAPSFFDAAVIERERENREAQRKWMAIWQPYLEKVYGPDPNPSPPDNFLPRLPHPNTQRAVDRRLPELAHWLAVGALALERHRSRHPHGEMSLARMARLLTVAFALKKLALGLDSPNPLPAKIEYDQEWTDLKRAYGHHCEPAPRVAEGGDGAPPCPVSPAAISVERALVSTKQVARADPRESCSASNPLSAPPSQIENCGPVGRAVPCAPPPIPHPHSEIENRKYVGGAGVPARRPPGDTAAVPAGVGEDDVLPCPVAARPEAPPPPRCDVYSRLARQLRRKRGDSQ